MDVTPYGPSTQCVLHVDVDAFFCQVEALRNPALRGLPIAIIQDRDVIAVSYPARQAGVKKYMNPTKARELLQSAGGRLVRVFQESDTRVSYRPYREASSALMRLLRTGLPPPYNLQTKVVEKASIDEAFILVAMPAAGKSHNTNTAAVAGSSLLDSRHQAVGTTTASGTTAAGALSSISMSDWVAAHANTTWDLKPAAAVAAAVRAAVHQSLGLTVSVGVAPNKLLAKLASRMAKPDGVFVVESVQQVQQLLSKTPVDRIPGLGGSVAAALMSQGISHIAQLQQYSITQLSLLLGGQQQGKLATRLYEAGWGRDAAAVIDKGPPKSIQVQLAINAHLWRARILEASEAAAGAPAGPNPAAAAAAAADMSSCLAAGAADTLSRLESIIQAVAGDLLGRVMLDRHNEDRWPKKLTLTLGIYTAGQQPKPAAKSTAFPTPALLITQSAAAGAVGAAVAQTPAASEACGNQDSQQQRQVQQQLSGVDVQKNNSAAAAAAAVAAAPQSPTAAAAVSGPAFCAPGVVGEKSFAVGAEIHERVVQLAVGLAQAILAPLSPNQCVGHLNLSVGNFGPFEAAAIAGNIKRFATVAAATAKPERQQPRRQQQQGEQENVAAEITTNRPQQQQQQQVATVKDAVLHDQSAASYRGVKRQRGPPDPPAAAAAARAGSAAVDTRQQQQANAYTVAAQLPQRHHHHHHHHQQQQQQQEEVRCPNSVLPSRPPVLLSHVLQHLADKNTTAAAAAQQLDKMLAAVGRRRLLMAGS